MPSVTILNDIYGKGINVVLRYKKARIYIKNRFGLFYFISLIKA